MFSQKLFVLCFTVIASAVAAPGFIGGYAPAVSHVERVDIHNSKPIISAYEAPIGISPVAAYPAGYGGHYGYPLAHSYSNRVDVHSPSIVTPVIGYGHQHGYGHHGYSGLGGYGLHDGAGYGYAVHGYGIQGLHHGY